MTIIETKDKKIGEDTLKVFSVLQGGNSRYGYMQMDCRLSNGKSEGIALFIDIASEKEDKTGDYMPFEFEKDELKQFIDFLTESYNKMP